MTNVELKYKLFLKATNQTIIKIKVKINYIQFIRTLAPCKHHTFQRDALPVSLSHCTCTRDYYHKYTMCKRELYVALHFARIACLWCYIDIHFGVNIG